MEYNFREIEKKWQDEWKRTKVYKTNNDSSKPKFYVLDMFPYPSGAGLHVGHPLGYIASDIFARHKKLKGFNVLHPMGYDAFGLPAEQYAIEHGIHPAASTEQNIKNFRAQLDKIGFCFDWNREVNTSYPDYYKWTQWIFLKLFKSFYNRKEQKAQSIDHLISIFEREGNINHPIPNSQFQPSDDGTRLPAHFSAENWTASDEKTRQTLLMEYRLAYCGFGEVNWCEGLGTVLANDEVINGVSERGGFPVVKKKLRQWYLRITEYADRLLDGLEKVHFSEAMKEMQTNWIGKSSGAEIDFRIITSHDANEDLAPSLEPAKATRLRVYTTRPDTIFGVDFMVIAPEHELVTEITAEGQKGAVEEYLTYVKSRSDRERQAEKKITGVFTGSYAENPFNNRAIPVWISEYVLGGYGTGAIMAVPCGDERDFKFANHFNIPITNIIGGEYDGEQANPTKDAILENSDFLNGLVMRDAIAIVMDNLVKIGIGKKKVNYKMRDAAFSRQRYWGEPFPIAWKNGIAHALDENELPLKLPHVDSYRPGPDGEGPLANIKSWTSQNLETNTMPGYAGSSWYFLRYMDPHNDVEFCNRQASNYWGQVDVYVGGTEHAVGHLLYSRMWTKFLYDLDLLGHDEPYKKLVNQGMIQGVSMVAKTIITKDAENSTLILPAETTSKPGGSAEIVKHYIPVDYVDMVEGRNILTEKNLAKLRKDEPVRYGNFELATRKRVQETPALGFEGLDVESILKNIKEGYVTLEPLVEKMSKSKYNVVNPDDIISKYGADTFRMYEMFLGPVEQSKPWDTKGIEGVHRFLKKLWRLFYDEEKGKVWNEENANDAELKILHKTIKKMDEDTERFSFNTGVSAAMIAVNELSELKCHKKEILEPLLLLLASYAPHITEELWHLLGNESTIIGATYPKAKEKYLVESTKNYPIAFNGKTRTELTIALDATQGEVEEIVLTSETVKKWLEGKTPKKIIYVKNKMINVVV